MHITNNVILEPVHLHVSKDLMNKFYIFRPIYYMYFIFIYVYLIIAGDRRGRDRIAVGFSHLQLYVKSVPTATNVVSSNPVHGEVYSIQLCVIKFVSDRGRSVVFCMYSGFSTNKADLHNITVIVLKVALTTVTIHP